MKTTKEILKSLSLPISKDNTQLAKNYLQLIELVQELKNDITDVQVLDLDVLPKNKDCKFMLDNVFDKENLKTLKIETSFGSYQFTVPTNTYFYSYLCVLLGIQSNYIKPQEEVKNTIYIDNQVQEAITKAFKFIDKKAFYGIANDVHLIFKDGFVEVFATNGRAMYKSRKFDFISDFEIEKISISENFKNSKNDFLKIELLADNFALFNDVKVETPDVDIKQLQSFSFETDGQMEFSKNEFSKNLKSLAPMLDFRKNIKFHLNGSIQMQPITDDANATEVKMDYLSKDFQNLDLCLGYKDLSLIMTSIKSKNVVYSPQDNKGVFTDGIDNFLIMNQK